MPLRTLKAPPKHAPWRLRREEKPLRAEPFSEDHLAEHSRNLAGTLRHATPRRADRKFLERFYENAQFLRDAIQMIAAGAREGMAIRPDAEWLLDNFYIVEEQLREIHDDLPRRYLRELPKNESGEPRIYVMAVELVTHTDSVLDEEVIVRFVSEFQVTAPLSMGEIWAIPIMLRLVLTENLRRIAAQMLSGHASERKATQLVSEWTEGTPFPFELTPIDEHGSLVFHILDQLQQDAAANLERIRELERHLASHDLTIQQSIHLEHQRQASSQVSIGNVITSMRLISAVDWVAFFERTNLTEQVLRQDPAGVYSKMDFESRDRYRHFVEDLTDGCSYSETEIAQALVRLAEQNSDNSDRSNHIGFWLFDAGRDQLEAELCFRPRIVSWPSRWLEHHPHTTYLGGIAILTLCAVVLFESVLRRAETPIVWHGLLIALAVILASDLAVGIVNTLITTWLRPRLLPKMNFSRGIPEQHRTVVVVPCMLSSASEVRSLLDRLELHFLANADPALSFALLTDLPDAAQEELPQDAALIEIARSGIRTLNLKHASDDHEPFFLFHRSRQWNPEEQIWMGWERKRGKLMEFNRLLLGRTNTSYRVQEGQVERLLSGDDDARVRFVITLDSDTTLPHEAARRLIGTLSHPLNKPVYSRESRRVTSGYVLLQPRVTVKLSSAENSRFAQVFANNRGLDPYSTCASDVYQDLFAEGSFTGKGIYELDVFEEALESVFPENQILSHDLIEGCHTRVALVSDIELFDNYPQKYEADAKRQHRWVRGDWQILPWLFPIVPCAQGHRPNCLSLLSRWKIFDNLRRSIVPPAMIAFLAIGWLAEPQLAWLFTGVVLLISAFAMLAGFVLGLRGWPRNVSLSDHLQAVFKEFKQSLVQTVLTVGFLPHKAWLMIDAIFRTLVRMYVTHQKLMEWTTASEVERQLMSASGASMIKWLSVPLFAVGLMLFLKPIAILGAIPILAAWIASPLFVYWLDSTPKVKETSLITSSERQTLRLDARRIWAYFETYVGARDHWLPPDNIQEYPQEKTAHRISPTNEGLFLISALVARDFGYLSLHSLVDLWERNLSQWQQFDRFQGHFYNWYDTVTLQPLLPRYVSTVDSGNLAACLLTMQRGIEDVRSNAVLGAFLDEGLSDTVEMIVQAGDQMRLSDDVRVRTAWQQFTESLERLQNPDLRLTDDYRRWRHCAEQWKKIQADVASKIEPLATSLHGTNQGLLPQIRLLLDWLTAVTQEVGKLYGWLSVSQEGLVDESNTGDNKTAHLRWNVDDQSVHLICAKLSNEFSSVKTLKQLAQLEKQTIPILDELQSRTQSAVESSVVEEVMAWIERLRLALKSASADAQSVDGRLTSLFAQCEQLVRSMDFRILFNPQRKLFSIGFNLETARLDGSHYDMLCSEARLASFLAIAKGDVESRHWFRLGRQMTHTAGQVCLLSWGGTMFEYLMPHLFQKTYEESILMRSCKAAVARQQQYGWQRGVPWGISECAFGALAANSDYHYRSFGVPGLGLKRGLSKDLVISPYSTILALDFDAKSAIANLDRVRHEGGLGLWGYYESLDFTPERVPAGKRSIVVRCYMTHHQGMSLLAIGNFLKDGDVRRRFHANSLVRATELLLQERTPSSMPVLEPNLDEQSPVPTLQIEDELVSRRIIGVATSVPRLQLLSNGQYHVMVTSTGGGYSQFNAAGVTRWRSDATRDQWGQFLYLRDVQTGLLWSATYQPTCVEPSRYEVIYSIDKAEYYRRDGQIESYLEVAVSPENNTELRQLRLTNTGDVTRQIDICSYVELSMVEPATDLSHMAFQKLFIETEFVADKTALLAKRRPRDSKQSAAWAVHALSASSDITSTVQYETSRQAFIGRGKTLQNPRTLERGQSLTGCVGAVLDPIFSLRCRVIVQPEESVTIAFTTSMATSRDEAIAIADQYHDARGIQRAFELAWAYSQVELRHLHLSAAKMHLYQRLASAMLYMDRGRRATADRLRENRLGQRALWRFAVSGTRPILLVYVTKPEHIDLVRETVGAHLYWKGRGLQNDLVIINDNPGSYIDELQEHLIGLLQEMQIRLDDQPAEVFLLRGSQLSQEDKILFESVASVVLTGDRGSFGRQVESGTISGPSLSVKSAAFRRALPANSSKALTNAASFPPHKALDPARFQIIGSQNLEFWNGYGGFAREGREYHIHLGQQKTTPMPWSNVIANPNFGCLVTESGGGYTWFANSRENKLTTWANDPILDTPSEMLYIFDMDSREVFSPFAALPRRDNDYWVQHGQGYTKFIHRSNNLAQQVFVSIAPDDAVKFIVLTLRNDQPQYRRLSISYFAEWVLGVSREETQSHVVTAIDEATGALLATNVYHPEFPGQVAFLHVLHSDRTVTGDRTEFLGRNGNLSRPVGVGTAGLSGRTGAGLDPCGAVQASIRLGPFEETELIFLLGAVESSDQLAATLARFNTAGAVHQGCEETQNRWNQTLETIQVQTPNRAFDLLLNRWLLYQVLSCRVWGRSAYYQSGGAYGFRDQLQDVMALVYSQPSIARDQILRAAARQFEEGDVQHWWHPPAGRGTRTRFSDDLLWLPLVVCHYLAVTQDDAVFDVEVSFLTSPPLAEHEQERYETPAVSTSKANLYEHCRRTIERSLRTGTHGLPLMGCGDWNDGMNKVGEGGQGESVWVAWFLLVVLDQFLPLMERRGDVELAKEWKFKSESLRHAIEDNAWDGEWYRRAYFDDGTPLGSSQNDECQIDSIAQTWAVIASGDHERSRIAIESVMKRLVEWKEGLALLFTPPFNQTELDPGYIKGYVPGIRENGGQYTHAATWLVQALTLLDDGDRALEVFDLINPIHHALKADAVNRYLVEPYVICADLYSVAPHVGRGGWSWYTGSAAWFYRVALESILGFHLRGSSVRFTPKIPKSWDGFQLRFRSESRNIVFHIIRPSISTNGTLDSSDKLRVKVGESIALDNSTSQETVVLLSDEDRHNSSPLAKQPNDRAENSAPNPSENGNHSAPHPTTVGENAPSH